MRQKLSMAAALLALLAASATAQALTIGGLVNTGANLANNAVDTNYQLSALTANSVVGPYGYVADHTGWPDGGPWIATGNDSRWITPGADEAASFSTGTYQWRLNFDLTGFDAATAEFIGRVSADDYAQVFLNGNLLASTPNVSYTGWTAFAANLGFLSGINTLDFIVSNHGGGPTGLRVEFLSSNVEALPPAPVPEPGTLALAGLALAGLAMRRRKSA